MLVFSQQPTPTPEKKNETSDDDIVRVNVNLIQVEAIVKDKRGKVVTDLQKDDFEIEENGCVHPLDYLSFVPLTENREGIVPSDKRLSRNDVRRTFVFMLANPVIVYSYSTVTAGGIFSGSGSFSRDALQGSQEVAKFLNKFIDEQMGERDLVSIFDTGADMGLLTSFTNDRELLRAAVKQVRNNIGQGRYPVIRISAENFQFALHQLIQQNLDVLQTAENAVEELQKVPGRKIVVLLSRGFVYHPDLPGSERVREKMLELIKKANQAQVTFYALSPAGVGREGGIRGRGNALQDLDAIKIIADETGGRAIYNTNDVSIGFSEILRENKGYYLLAYNPGQENLPQAHQIKVRVKRPGFYVQTRSTAFNKKVSSGTPDSNEELLRIVRSPFSVNEVSLNLSPTFQSTTKTDGRINTVLKIASTDIEPELQTDGTRHIKLDLAIQIKAPDNRLIRQEIKTYTLKLNETDWTKIQSEGLAYQFDTNINQAGYYQISVAVRLPNSGRIGSISRFINCIHNSAMK
jgi:VWFA-related protein